MTTKKFIIVVLLFALGIWLVGRNCFLGISGGAILPTDPMCQWSCSDRKVHIKAPWFTCAGESAKVRRYRVAAEQGDADAQWRLASEYEYGTSVRANRAEALRWHRKAADQGHALAQVDLGEYYAAGEGGVRQDYVQAHQSLTLGTGLGWRDGRYWVAYHRGKKMIEEIEPKMTPDEIAEAQRRAREWWEKHEMGMWPDLSAPPPWLNASPSS